MSTVTVLSGPERRRRWAASDKARIVAESLQPGANVRAIAQRHDVHPNLLHAWRRQARSATRLNLVPVTVAAERKERRTGASNIEIDLGDGVRLRVDGGVDEAALGRVLRALGR